MNTKMKVLSLALIGAFGYVGSAAAGTCPAGPTVPEGGAWTSKTVLAGTVAIATPGFDGTSCRMDASITANTGAAAALVQDDTPAAEESYRAQFVVDLDALAGLNLTQTVRLFAATTTAPSAGVPDVVQIGVFGNLAGTSKVLGISTACAENASGRCSTSFPLSGTGQQRIELAWGRAATDTLRIWVNNNTEASHDIAIDATNAAWGGVDSAFLGLATPSPGFRAAQLNNVVSFDQFDSRRQTFIGN